jgi:hypothetical protein
LGEQNIGGQDDRGVHVERMVGGQNGRGKVWEEKKAGRRCKWRGLQVEGKKDRRKGL